MTKFENLFCAALANGTICTGNVPEWQLKAWFGDRGGITREEIATRQASEYAKQAFKHLGQIEREAGGWRGPL